MNEEMLEIIRYYANPDYWHQPNGGGEENIFEPPEFFRDYCHFNGYNKAAEFLEKYEELKEC